MKVEQVAPSLLRLSLMEPDHTNAYLAGDVLIDAGGRFSTKKLLSALGEHTVSAHAITHAHFDHQGGSRGICTALGIPFWCGSGDREAVESGDLTRILPDPKGILGKLHQALAGPGHPVAKVLEEGDDVGGFTAVETPGHTPGHLAFWREADGVLILGDVLFNRNPLSLRTGLQEPFRWATFDPDANRSSARKLAGLTPSVVCFGHGAPLKDGERLLEFVSTL
jgi:glyoxylase-like metal-dependent hydrolase (beta-lactamase superfamily II)